MRISKQYREHILVNINALSPEHIEKLGNFDRAITFTADEFAILRRAAAHRCTQRRAIGNEPFSYDVRILNRESMDSWYVAARGTSAEMYSLLLDTYSDDLRYEISTEKDSRAVNILTDRNLRARELSIALLTNMKVFEEVTGFNPEDFFTDGDPETPDGQ